MTDFLLAFDAVLPGPSGRPRRYLGMFQRSDELNQMREWRTRIVNRWGILHNEVRPALPGNGRIADGPATAAQQATEQLLKPGRNPWGPNANDERSRVQALLYFLRDVKALCQAASAVEAYR